jgi:hypothetical protein
MTYENTEVKMMGGGRKIVRSVSIKNGKGIKSITKYHKGKKMKTYKKPIKKAHIDYILAGKFIPGLFADCGCKKNKSRKNK